MSPKWIRACGNLLCIQTGTIKKFFFGVLQPLLSFLKQAWNWNCKPASKIHLCFYEHQHFQFYVVTQRFKQLMFHGSTVWSNCSSDNIMRVFKLQKRAARVFLEADTRSNNVKHFKKLEWPPFNDQVNWNKCVLVFKYLLGSCPSYMYDILKFNADLHSRTVAIVN